MIKINDLIEWDYCGSRFSFYAKHFVDDNGRWGITMIFEDLTRDKVTEITIPARQFPAFLKTVNGGEERYRGLF